LRFASFKEASYLESILDRHLAELFDEFFKVGGVFIQIFEEGG
jgi:hypothetical protein